MAIVVTCSTCNTRLTLGDDRAGDRFECPQCDATIKVPGPEQSARTSDAAAPATAPAPTPTRTRERDERDEPPRPARRRKRNRERDEEPESGIDKRVIGGIIGAGVGLFFVLLVVVLLASRKPTESAQQGPSTPGDSSGSNLTGGWPSGGGAQPGTSGESAPPRGGTAPQPGIAVGGTPQPQFFAQFLGAQGQGRRFCIIADNSGSMNGPNILDLRAQLLKSITELNANSEFFVFAFNSNPEPMPHHTWLRAGAPEVENVKRWVRALPARNGTNPAPAFAAAFQLNPPPDVIFFMTDGLIPGTVPAQVATMNGNPPRTAVNTIMFAPNPFARPPLPPGAPPGFAPPVAPPPPVMAVARAEDLLKQIASQNRGTFTRYAPP